MPTQLDLPMRFIPEFWRWVLEFLYTDPIAESPVFIGCNFGLSLDTLDFGSGIALSNTIISPTFPGYADAPQTDASLYFNAGFETVATELPAFQFRMDDSNPPVSEALKGLWVGSGSNLGFFGGVNFPTPIGVSRVGDGFDAKVRFSLGSGGIRGIVTLIY